MLIQLNLLVLALSYVSCQGTCDKSITQRSVDQSSFCANQVIFEDKFDNFDSEKWRHTIKISSLEDEEFVVYDNRAENIYVKDGKLFIKPTVMAEDTVSAGVIDLKMCTGRYQTTDCYMRSTSYNIIPPVESAQISTKDFHFKYGVIEIRAKFPTGDWIYPQLWLQSKFKEYGQLFNSGRIIIASVRGNKELKTVNGEDIGNRFLKVGFVLGIGEEVFIKYAHFEITSETWAENFHTFKFIWKPNSMEAVVDGQHQELVTENSSIASQFQSKFGIKQSVWEKSSPNAPFDKNFYLTLGVAVGGKREFPDGITTKNSHKKPWQNIGSVKKLLNFWKDRNNWFSTWNGEESALQVDYVKVTAL